MAAIVGAAAAGASTATVGRPPPPVSVCGAEEGRLGAMSDDLHLHQRMRSDTRRRRTVCRPNWTGPPRRIVGEDASVE